MNLEQEPRTESNPELKTHMDQHYKHSIFHIYF